MSGPRSEPAFGVGACASVQQRYERRDRVGEGTYGVIYRAWDRQLQRVVALKRLLPHNEAQDGFPLTSLREVSTLRLLRGHANVVTFLDVAVGARRDAVFLSLEFAEHGDLGSLLDDRSIRKGRKRLFDISQTKCLTKQLLLALRHCHERYVCHRDVKVANLLYTAEGRLKLCDFGLARIIPSIDRALTQNVVTLWYRAPEVLLRYDLGVPPWCLHTMCRLQERKVVSFLILGPFGPRCSAQVAVLRAPHRLLGGGLRHRRDLSGWQASGAGFDA